MIRVLLVEDDPSIVSGLGAFLRGEDCAVTSAGSQREALDVFGAGKFDIALVDLSLPDGSGFAVCAGFWAGAGCALGGSGFFGSSA